MAPQTWTRCLPCSGVLALILLAGCSDSGTVSAPKVLSGDKTDVLGALDGSVDDGTGATDDAAAVADAIAPDPDAVGGDSATLDDVFAAGDAAAPEDGAGGADAIAGDDAAADGSTPDPDASAGDSAPSDSTPSDPCVGAGGSPLACDDGNPCTTDGCAAPAGCSHTVIAGCVPPCSADADCAATGQVCDTATHICAACTASAGCAKGSSCVAGKCVAVPVCVSSKDCKATSQVCDLSVGVCVDCIGDNDCTSPNVCVAHVCVAQQKCISDNQCSGVCDKAAGICVDCNLDVDCAATSFCGPAKTCLADVCSANLCAQDGFYACKANGSGYAAKATCDDGSSCTDDSCDAAKGCVFKPQPDGTSCEAGTLCTMGKTCKAGACVAAAGNGVGCDDGNVCTTDSCDSAKGCLHTAVPGQKCTAAVDGSPCTSGTIACLASGKCGEGPAPGWTCCGDPFGPACDAVTAGWTLTGDAATAETVGETKTADTDMDFLAVGTQPTESKVDGSGTRTIATTGATSGVLIFSLQIASQEFGQGCGQNNQGTYQDSLTISIDGKAVFAASVGDFCQAGSATGS